MSTTGKTKGGIKVTEENKERPGRLRLAHRARLSPASETGSTSAAALLQARGGILRAPLSLQGECTKQENLAQPEMQIIETPK